MLKQPLDTLGKYYDSLEITVRNSHFKNLLNTKYKKFKKYSKVKEAQRMIQKGNKAPLFSLVGVDQKKYTIDFTSKTYKVLDFWGSWCGPCVQGFPKMKEYHEKYNDKINFIGIACKDNEANWKKAIEKHKLPWLNLINLNSLEMDVSIKYAVRAYPTKVLINSKGKIVEVFKGEGDDFYDKLDQL
ncbi:TlpA family protein disulfide reductase [Flammeovirga aprica]|uniref:TlpA family protein disulfide reductase n=1 Tax=Flammeovirga aprica JL-4 TaxID=694437 RepID=A0A7X9X9R2_9BACT|nr:TlpA disulfide reductase family protein [Flammeovirga aprica]NME69042.1 TlpA family protein disulfide reductase [Flammeovirga aprica JL-4]